MLPLGGLAVPSTAPQLIHLPTHSSIHKVSHSSLHPSIHPSTHSSIHPSSCSLGPSFMSHSFIISFIHSFHSVSYSRLLSHSFIHSVSGQPSRHLSPGVLPDRQSVGSVHVLSLYPALSVDLQEQRRQSRGATRPGRPGLGKVDGSQGGVQPQQGWGKQHTMSPPAREACFCGDTLNWAGMERAPGLREGPRSLP